MKHIISLRTALIISLTLVMLVVSAVQSFYLYTATSREIADNIKDISADTVQAHKETLNQYLRSIENLSFTIQNSSAVQKALQVPKDSNFLTQYRSNQEVTSFLEKLSYSYDDIAGIALMTRARSVYNYASPFGFYDANLLTNTALLAALGGNNKTGFVPTFDNDIIQNSSYKNLFCYYNKLYRNNKHVATLCILIDSKVFKRIAANSLKQGEPFFISSDRNIVYPYKQEDFTHLFETQAPFDGKPIRFQNQTYLPMPAVLSNGWTMVDLVSSNKINRSSAIIIQNMLLGFLLAFMLYFLCIYLISHSVSGHLNKLNRKMSTVGIKPYVFKDTSHISEIAMLNNQFNSMSNRIDELLCTVKNEQKEIDKGQLELLHAQINPHFLYNTLDAINWMAIERNADDISAMTSNLAAMFRYGLNSGAEMTSIANEISHLEKYIEIQKYRYNNRFSFSKQVDDTLLTQRTLNIILQPIVENSLLHGFRDSQDTIALQLTLTRRGHEIVFCLTDDGIGCNPDFMNDYLSATQTTTKGYGVKNIHKRLQLHFGAAYGIHYLPTALGTCVEITIPYEGVSKDV